MDKALTNNEVLNLASILGCKIGNKDNFDMFLTKFNSYYITKKNDNQFFFNYEIINENSIRGVYKKELNKTEILYEYTILAFCKNLYIVYEKHSSNSIYPKKAIITTNECNDICEMLSNNIEVISIDEIADFQLLTVNEQTAGKILMKTFNSK